MGKYKGNWTKKLIVVLLATFAAAGILLVGCNEQAQTRSSFSYAESSEPSSLDPTQVDETTGGNIARYLFDGLVTYDSETSEVKPAVAENWESTDDATVYTFHLRDGLKFSDGAGINAQTFVDSWTRALAPATKSSTAMAVFQPVKGASALADGETDKLTGVQAVDANTLKVTLDYPMADFVSLLGHPAASPVPAAAADNKQSSFAENPVGNGPYQLKEWRHDDSIVLDFYPWS